MQTCGGAALLLGVLVALALPGCRTAPEDLVLEPVARLWDQVTPPLLPDTRCGLRFDVRPALGCLSTVSLLDTRVTPDPSGRILAEIEVPEELRGDSLILIPAVLSEKKPGLPVLPRRLITAPGARLTFDATHAGLIGVGPLRLIVVAAPARATFPEWTTAPVEIADGSELRVALAIHPDLIRAGADAVYFRIVARTARALAGEATGRDDASPASAGTVLLDESVEPDDATRGWIERRISLDQLAGRRVELTFSNRLATTDRLVPATDPAGSLERDATSPLAAPEATAVDSNASAAPARPGFSAPLWGAPRILAPRPRGPHRNIILVSLDTMRADLLGRHEGGRAVTPELDALAREGAVFLDTISAFTSTTASHMSLLTSTYPAQHEVTYPAQRLPRWIPTLTETLAQAGYATAAFTENAMITAEAGFARGFDVFVADKRADGKITAGAIDETLARGLRWIRANSGSPFFVFLHTSQVHYPFDPPADFAVFRATNDVAAAAARADARERPQPPGLAPYLGEMLYTDARLGAFVGELKWRDLLDNSLLVITSDHGEEFEEHGGLGHGHSTYEELIRVPLLVVAPGRVPPGIRVTDQVSGIDVAPTILSLVDVAPPETHHGRSLFPLLAGNPSGDMPVRFAEAVQKPVGAAQRRIYAARDGRYKWIFAADDSTPLEIYDLDADPAESRSLRDPSLVERGRSLWHQLNRLKTAAGARTGREMAAAADREAPSPDTATARKLAALGYIDELRTVYDTRRQAAARKLAKLGHLDPTPTPVPGPTARASGAATAPTPAISRPPLR